MAHTTTPNLGMQDYFTTTLNGNVASTDTVINLNAVPTSSEGFLVIDPNNVSTREVIYYNTSGVGTVTCPDHTAGSGRGLGGTSVQAHLSGVLVEMREVAEYWEALQNGESLANGSIATANLATGIEPATVATNPYKFLVYRNAATASGNNAYALLTFDTKVFDTGSNYSTGTGLFTAPVNGFYYFDATAKIDSSVGTVLSAIYKNGSIYIAGQSAYASTASKDYDTSFHGLLQLSANDTIGFYTNCSVGSEGIEIGSTPINTWMSGRLVSVT